LGAALLTLAFGIVAIAAVVILAIVALFAAVMFLLTR